MERMPAAYLMSNRPRGTLYTGVTGNLPQRVWHHKSGISGGFCKRYSLHRLVYYELHSDMYTAILREKQIKGGSRRRKISLIERMNPDWRDLYGDIVG